MAFLYNLAVENNILTAEVAMATAQELRDKAKDLRDKEEAAKKRAQYWAIKYAQERAAAEKLPFETVEEAVIRKVGKGIPQSKLTADELGRAQKLMAYGRNSSIKPKLMSVYRDGAVWLIPYIKERKPGVNMAGLARLRRS
jgi:hypothetical protein